MPVTGSTPRNYQSPYNATSLLAHLAGGTLTSLGGSTTIAVCLKITPVTGAAVGYTSNTRDLSNLNGHAGVTFKQTHGMMPTTVDASSGLAVPNVEIKALLASTGVSELQWLAGAWSNAEFEVFIVNYEALKMGDLVLLGGNLGRGKLAGQLVQIEGLGFNERAQLNVGNVFSPACRVKNFGDARCAVAGGKAAFTFTGTVSASPAPTTGTFTVATSGAFSPAKPNGRFDHGEAECLTGANAGLMREIKTQTGNAFTLKDKFPYPISAGDTFALTQGCNRTIEMCGDLYDNAPNFDAEAYVPGLEKAYTVVRTVNG